MTVYFVFCWKQVCSFIDNRFIEVIVYSTLNTFYKSWRSPQRQEVVTCPSFHSSQLLLHRWIKNFCSTSYLCLLFAIYCSFTHRLHLSPAFLSFWACRESLSGVVCSNWGVFIDLLPSTAEEIRAAVSFWMYVQMSVQFFSEFTGWVHHITHNMDTQKHLISQKNKKKKNH